MELQQYRLTVQNAVWRDDTEECYGPTLTKLTPETYPFNWTSQSRRISMSLYALTALFSVLSSQTQTPDPPAIRFVALQYLCSSRRYFTSPPVPPHPFPVMSVNFTPSQLLPATVTTCTISVNCDTSQWTPTSRNVLASTQGISRTCRTFRRYLLVPLIMTVTVSSRRYL